MIPSIQELGYLGFEVSNLPRWERFATEVMGLGVSSGPQNTRRLRMDAAWLRLPHLPRYLPYRARLVLPLSSVRARQYCPPRSRAIATAWSAATSVLA